jgi:hypothetical protein
MIWSRNSKNLSVGIKLLRQLGVEKELPVLSAKLVGKEKN